MYRIFGWWYRWQACKLAAQAIGCRQENEAPAPLIWSLATFFECYLLGGSEGTIEDFGPKEPVVLKTVDKS